MKAQLKLTLFLLVSYYNLLLSQPSMGHEIIKPFQIEAKVEYTTGIYSVPISDTYKWINSIQAHTKNGEIHILIEFKAFDKGRYALLLEGIKNLDSDNLHFDFRPELVNIHRTRDKVDKIAIIVRSGEDLNNIQSLTGRIQFNLKLIQKEYQSFEAKALGVFSVDIYCHQPVPKLKLGWSIVQIIGLGTGTYLYLDGRNQVGGAWDSYQNDYRKRRPNSGDMIDNDFRISANSQLEQIRGKNDNGVNKQRWGIAILTVNTLWSLHRFSTYLKKKELHNSESCKKERRFAFQPYLDTNNRWTQSTIAGVTLTYTFK